MSLGLEMWNVKWELVLDPLQMKLNGCITVLVIEAILRTRIIGICVARVPGVIDQIANISVLFLFSVTFMLVQP